VLLAAHGERRAGASNAGVVALAAALAQRLPRIEVRYGFINGAPSIDDEMSRFTELHIFVYPLFMSDGYFTRRRLPQLLAKANQELPSRHVTLVPPFGHERALAGVIAARVAVTARVHRYFHSDVTAVLLAHGSRKDCASLRGAEALCAQVRAISGFADVSCAFLEEPPALRDRLTGGTSPVFVVGLFVGDGLHGGQDVPALVDATSRRDVSFVGNVGEWSEVVEVVANSVNAGCPPLFYLC